MCPLIIVGDSWSSGEWIRTGEPGQIQLSHPGISEYLSNNYKVINLSRPGNSLWQIQCTLANYLETHFEMLKDQDFKVLVFQTDAYRPAMHQAVDVDLNRVYNNADNLKVFYENLIEIFYIKCNDIGRRYGIDINLSAGLSDLNINLLNGLDHIKPVCNSWIKLLHDKHIPSIIPLQMKSEFFEESKKRARLDLCDQILDHSNQQFLFLQELLESDLFGPSLGDFHPNRTAHKILADYILGSL